MADGFKLEVFADLAGEWRWRMVAGNGRIVATSGEAFASKGNAERAAEMIAGEMAAAGSVPVYSKPGGEVR
jgi:uncharacterized protein YegP (UPF0339 family)